MTTTPEPTSRLRTARSIHLVLTAVMGLAFVGFLVGIDYGVPKADEAAVEGDLAVDATFLVPSMSYADMREAKFGPNRDWMSELRLLPRAVSGVPATSSSIDRAVKLASLELRNERRAYNGAPPIIPHVVDQMSNDNCLSCHGQSLRIENRTANAMPHPSMTSCQQCHAPASSSPFSSTLVVNNTFEGLPAPFEGQRAWPGAPPIVPHSTFMRDNCLACHGPTALPGLRTTHPERQQCLQCHGSSAELNQAVVAQASMFLPPPRLEVSP